MEPDNREGVHALFQRLLRENAQHDPKRLRRPQKPIVDSRRLLAQVARDHPEIE